MLQSTALQERIALLIGHCCPHAVVREFDFTATGAEKPAGGDVNLLQPDDGPTMPGDYNLLALFNFVEQAGEIRLRFMNIILHSPILALMLG
jgi:hypothetical protein